MNTPRNGWTAVTQVTATEVLHKMRVSGFSDLHDQIVRFLRALALEVGNAVEFSKTPPGLPVEINGVVWYSVPIPREGVFFNYSIYPEDRQIRVCDLIWVVAN